MWDGFVLWDGELYAHNIDLVCSWLRSRNVDPENELSDEYILKEAYECDEYYWATWFDEPLHLWHQAPEQLVSLVLPNDET